MAGSRRLTELARQVTSHLRLPPSGPLVVALSGGADSAVCGWAAVESGERARAMHVHHGLPGSDLMAEAAAAIAQALDLQLQVVALEQAPGSEGAARSARYRALLSELAAGEWLLTGHTADDLAETVLANLLRGAGPDGLAGIPAVRGRIVRPLLEVDRACTRELATLLSLPWADDPANREAGPRRNVVRRELLPQLEARFNPALRASLQRTAAVLAGESELLDGLAGAVPLVREAGTVRVPVGALLALPAPVRRRVLRRALRKVRPPYGGSHAELEQLEGVAVGERGPLELAGGVRAERRGPMLALGPRSDPVVPPAAADLVVPGETRFGTWHLETWVEELAPLAFPLSAWTAVFDADDLGPTLTVRPAGAGGTIRIGTGHKSIAVALAEAGVSREVRSAWPVVADGLEVVWVPGVRRAATGWVKTSTTRYLWMDVTGRGCGGCQGSDLG